MALKSMKITKAERKSREKSMEATPMLDGDEYPYGLRINLDNDAIDKLGLKKLPNVGTTMRLEASVRVVEVSQNSRQDRDHRRVELQIEKMDLPKAAKSMEEAVDDGVSQASA